MNSQKAIFLSSEGDAWFDRNAKHLDLENDPVIQALNDLRIEPKVVLEIGCGSGARLAALHEMHGAQCHGIDPSTKAVEFARRTYPKLHVERGTATELPFQPGKFDLIIFGFCLYLCDPVDHFSIAEVTDRALAETGFLVIYDFAPPLPFKNLYEPFPGVFSYKMCWSRMFTWHPRYQSISRRYFEHERPWNFSPNETIAVDILRKDSASAFPLNPWSGT